MTWATAIVLCVALLATKGVTPSFAQTELRLATWNIQTLTTGKRVFADTDVRSKADTALLKEFAKSLPADVVALQEIASPAAITQVFPMSDWTVCVSGQFFTDAEVSAQNGVAQCFDDGDVPDTPLRNEFAKQFTGFAVRKNKVEIKSIADIAALGVTHINPKDGVVRSVRWGLLVSVDAGGQHIQILNLHLKSGCIFGFPNSPKTKNPADCETLFRQKKILAKAVSELEPPFAVVGDFNREFRANDPLWKAINAIGGRGSVKTDAGLQNLSPRSAQTCAGPASKAAIDHIVISAGLVGSEVAIHKPTPEFGTTPSDVAMRFGDHCPLSASLKILR